MRSLILALLLMPSFAFADPTCEGIFSEYPQFADIREDRKHDYEAVMLGLSNDISYVHYDRLVKELNLYETLFENGDEYVFEFDTVRYASDMRFKAVVTRSYLEELGQVLHITLFDVETGVETDKLMISEKASIESPIFVRQFGQPKRRSVLASIYGQIPMTGAVVVGLAKSVLGDDYAAYDVEYKAALSKGHADYIRHNTTGNLVTPIVNYLKSQPAGYKWEDALEYNTLYIENNQLIIEGRYFNTRVDLNKYDPKKPKFYFTLDGKKSSVQVNPRSLKYTGDWSKGKQWQIIFDLELFIQEMLSDGLIQGD